VFNSLAWLTVIVPIIYASGPQANAKLAEEVYQQLNAHKADNPSMGEVRRECGTAKPS
jgi:hypothetical protein